MVRLPAFVFIGANSTNTPQQNAGVFIGQTNNGAWDANMKFQAARSGNFGFSGIYNSFNVFNDNFELLDGVINDPDLKPSIDTNV